MGYIATDIARIPSMGFDWYVFVLSDGWTDPFRDELSQNFDRFSSAVGPNCLVVRGADPEDFYNSMIDTGLMKLADRSGRDVPLPALVVSSHSPNEIDETTGQKEGGDVKLMVFPLSNKYLMPGSITDFLKEMAESIQDGVAEDLDEDEIRSKWRWMINYLELKPNFCGFGVNLNKVIDDLFSDKWQGGRAPAL